MGIQASGLQQGIRPLSISLLQSTSGRYGTLVFEKRSTSDIFGRLSNSEVQRALAVIDDPALRHDQSDVVVLFFCTELLNLSHNRRYQGRRGQFSMLLQCLDQALFSERFSGMVGRFGYPIGVEHDRVSGKKAALCYRAIPFFEESQHG